MRRRSDSAGLLIEAPLELVVGSGVFAVGVVAALLALLCRYRDEGPVGGYPDLRRRHR